MLRHNISFYFYSQMARKYFKAELPIIHSRVFQNYLGRILTSKGCDIASPSVRSHSTHGGQDAWAGVASLRKLQTNSYSNSRVRGVLWKSLYVQDVQSTQHVLRQDHHEF
jgi:hypothetical protein